MVDNDVKDTNNDEQTLYDALVAGNDQEVSRLMAAKDDDDDSPEVDAEEEEVTEEDSPESEEKDSEGDKPEDEDGENTPDPEADKDEAKQEAAPAAASTLSDDERKELHRLRSDAGRVPHMQRRLVELERQLRANTARSDTKADISTEGVELPPALKAKYDSIREVDPDLADSFEETAKLAIAAAATRARTEVDSYARIQDEREDEAFIQGQLQQLSQMVPDYQKAFDSPQWKAWKETLTPGRRALAESAYAEEVAQALRAFAYDMRAAQGNQNSGSTTVEKQQPAAEAPTEVQNARTRKVQAAADVKSGAAKGSRELDADALYKEMYDQLAKESHLI